MLLPTTIYYDPLQGGKAAIFKVCFIELPFLGYGERQNVDIEISPQQTLNGNIMAIPGIVWDISDRFRIKIVALAKPRFVYADHYTEQHVTVYPKKDKVTKSRDKCREEDYQIIKEAGWLPQN